MPSPDTVTTGDERVQGIPSVSSTNIRSSFAESYQVYSVKKKRLYWFLKLVVNTKWNGRFSFGMLKAAKFSKTRLKLMQAYGSLRKHTFGL